MSDISDRILAEIEKKEYSYGELAKITGIPKSAVQRYATGETRKIPMDRVELLSKALNVSAEYIMGWETKNEPVTLSHDELDMELIKRLMQLTPEELQKVDAFVQGLLASR